MTSDNSPSDNNQSESEESAGKQSETGGLETKVRRWLQEYHQAELKGLNARLPEESWIRLSVETLEGAAGADLRDDLVDHTKRVENGVSEFKGIKKIIAELVGRDVDPGSLTIYWTEIPNQQLVGECRAKGTEQLVAVEGQIDQITGVDPVVSVGVFKCQRCGAKTVVEQNYRSDDLEKPNECHGCERQGPFQLDRSESEMRDRQQLRLQTPPEHAQDGVENLTVSIIGNLAGKHTGDLGRTAIVHGYLTSEDTDEWERPFLLQAHDIELIDEVDVDVTEHEDEIEEYESKDDPLPELVDSRMLPGMHAPQGSDLRMLKFAVLLQACSLPRLPGGKRGDIHLFACGDPSTGKSVVANLAAEIVPRSEIVSTRVTGVGLTAAGVHDELSGWTIKSGAIVRANNGLLVLDELDKIGDDHVQDLHTPLESQRVFASIADQSATLPAETSVLATANPKFGRWDPYEPIGQQLDVPVPLLSRFDLIITMEDTVEEERDGKVAGSVTEDFQSSLEEERGEQESRMKNEDVEFLRAWVAAAREYIPKLPDELRIELEEVYLELREQGDDKDSPVPVTVRQLEGLVRLAVASARASHSDVVTQQDVQRAKSLVRSSLEDVGVDPETGEFDADLVEVGNSKSQRDRLKSVTSVIDELSSSSNSGAHNEEVIAVLSEEGIDEEKATNMIEKLRQKGEIYEPQDRFYRVS